MASAVVYTTSAATASSQIQLTRRPHRHWSAADTEPTAITAAASAVSLDTLIERSHQHNKARVTPSQTPLPLLHCFCRPLDTYREDSPTQGPVQTPPPPPQLPVIKACAAPIQTPSGIAVTATASTASRHTSSATDTDTDTEATHIPARELPSLTLTSQP